MTKVIKEDKSVKPCAICKAKTTFKCKRCGSPICSFCMSINEKSITDLMGHQKCIFCGK